MLDSCTIAPANVKSSLTVAGSDLIRKFDDAIHHRGTSDVLYKYSNTGKCVDIFAPGTDIYSACGGKNRCRRPGDDEYAWSSGTSMAVPHVAGVAATILSNFPNATASEVKQMILDASVPDQIDSSFKAGAPLPSTPNRMLYSKIPGLEESSVPRTRGFSFSGAQPIDPYYSPEERRQFLRMSFPDVVDVYLNGLSDGWQDWSWDVSTDDAMGGRDDAGAPENEGGDDFRTVRVNILPGGALSFHSPEGFEAAAVEVWFRSETNYTEAADDIRITLESEEDLEEFIDEPSVVLATDDRWNIVLVEIPPQATVFDRITIRGRRAQHDVLSFEMYRISVFR